MAVDTGLYSFEGVAVDLKASNRHGSGMVDATLNADNTGVTTQISVGTIVMIQADGTIDSATQAAEKQAVGVATETRLADDNRPVTFTTDGMVRVMTASAVTIGDALRVSNGGKVETGTLGTHRIIGRALQGDSVGGAIIQALVNFSQ